MPATCQTVLVRLPVHELLERARKIIAARQTPEETPCSHP